MVKIESADQAKRASLDFLAKMGIAIWSSEVLSIKKSGDKWQIRIKSFIQPEIINMEIDAETGNVTLYEKSK
jgi:hypothetical protein